MEKRLNLNQLEKEGSNLTSFLQLLCAILFMQQIAFRQSFTVVCQEALQVFLSTATWLHDAYHCNKIRENGKSHLRPLAFVLKAILINVLAILKSIFVCLGHNKNVIQYDSSHNPVGVMC